MGRYDFTRLNTSLSVRLWPEWSCIGSVDPFLFPKTLPIMELCRRYLLADLETLWAVACDGSNEQRRCDVADRRSKPASAGTSSTGRARRPCKSRRTWATLSG